MASITNELVTQFSFSGSLNPLTQYNQQFANSIGLMTKGIGIITAVQGAMYGFATAQLQSIDAMGQLSRETGVSVEAMQEMGYVASVNGGKVEDFQNSIVRLSEKIGEYAKLGTGEGKAVFEGLGISVKKSNGEVKNANEVMDDLRQKFQTLSKTEQISVARKLGIEQGMIQTLNLTNDQMDELKKRVQAIGVVSSADADKVMAFNDAVTTSKMAITGLSRQVALGMLPSMMDLVGTFNDFIFANGDLIRNGLSKTLYWLESTTKAVGNTGKAIFKAIDHTIGFTNAMYLLGAGILYVNRGLLLSPIGRIIGLISGLVLVVDDLYVGLEGGQSVIADFFNSFGIDILSNFNSVIALASTGILYFSRALLLSPIGLIISGVTMLTFVVNDVNKAFNGGQSIIKDFFGAFNIDIVNVLKNAFDGLKFTLNSFLLLALKVSTALTDIALVGGRLGNVLGFDIDTSGLENFKKVQEQTRLNLEAENRNLANNIVNRNNTTNQNVTINQTIQGTEAKQIAEVTNSGISQSLKNAVAGIPEGGR